MFSIKITTVGLFILCTTAGLLAQEKDLSAYDKNADKKLSQEEFEDMLRSTNWFSEWDINDNSFINVQEWQDGIEKMYPGKDLFSKKTFREWDLNADHFINDDEFRIGMFKWWDEDGNEFISQEEFSEWRFEGDIKNKSRAGGK